MQIDLRTVSIKPLRNTFNHVAEHIGGDKAASRYLEGTLRLQAENNFHYRPLWDPEHKIFDPSRTRINMKDWYAFKDPRQFYYGTYTIARAKMQETAEADFDFVEERGLTTDFPEGARQRVLSVLLPLRHVAWGSNMNNSFICAYGYGTAITQPCLYAAMDQLGIAQYLSRLGLAFGDVDDLKRSKEAWLGAPAWQELRRYVEDTFVLKDWFELYVAQNVALDGILYPLIYDHFDADVVREAGSAVSMIVRFQEQWFSETSRWVDAMVKIAAAESPENKVALQEWLAHWLARARTALAPIATLALGAAGETALAASVETLEARLKKAGVLPA